MTLFLLFLVASGVGTLAQAPSMQKLQVIGGGGLTGRVAAMNGTFAKYGLEVQSTVTPNSDTTRSGLASGQYDIAESGLDNAVAMVDQNGSDVIIVTGSSDTDNELIAQPGFKSPADLRGKTVTVDAPNTQNALQLKKILLLSGLKVGADYQMAETGVTALRAVQMRTHKEYAATMMGGAIALTAKREGFVSLGSTSKLIGRLVGGGAFVRRDWGREHAELLERYIAANIEIQRWIMSPANKTQVIEMMRGTGDSKLAADLAAQAYEMQMHGTGALSKDLQLDVEGLKGVLKLRAEVEGSWGGKPPAVDKFYDLSYYRKALTMVK